MHFLSLKILLMMFSLFLRNIFLVSALNPLGVQACSAVTFDTSGVTEMFFYVFIMRLILYRDREGL